ncbi:hypothetical protein SOVF_075820 [Spinacia oleracea]|uniref:Uncharacterized protein isoform X1 n=1 Tax=Spinacia oleracea TaxID=3562 RepID=A0A9R0IMK8_SPIOL|nr:uncharacterized protein LOC110791690 isoform X1 [Spinacia oleracea]KNA17889.1 hypothetical protein SOVF_075820 [Spinacia oleracea]
MASKLAKEEEGSSKTKKRVDDWKFPKIPVNQVYKKKMFRIFTSYAVREVENTVTLREHEQNVTIHLLSERFLKGFIKKKHRYMHLGLVQIAIKPLQRDGLKAPIVICLRDSRQREFHNSLLSLVETDLSQGPFYFNCFPSFSFSLTDTYFSNVLILKVATGRIPLALTYRWVCKVMPDLCSGALKEPVLGETGYFHPTTGTQGTSKWDEVQVPECWTRKA